MCLMSVVFPAPLAPTRPYTPPRDIDRLTESSAVIRPKRRVRSVMLITGSVIMRLSWGDSYTSGCSRSGFTLLVAGTLRQLAVS